MPHKVGSKWRWGNVERGSKKELAQTVYGIWKKNGSKGDFGDFWRKGKSDESVDFSKKLDFQVNRAIQEAYAKVRNRGSAVRRRIGEGEEYSGWTDPDVWKTAAKEGLKGGGRAIVDTLDAFGRIGSGALSLFGQNKAAKRMDRWLDRKSDQLKHGDVLGSDFGRDFDKTSDFGGKLAGFGFTSAAGAKLLQGLGMVKNAAPLLKGAETAKKLSKATKLKDMVVQGLKGYGTHAVGDTAGNLLERTGHETAGKWVKAGTNLMGLKTAMSSPSGGASPSLVKKVMWGAPGGLGLSIASQRGAEAAKRSGMIDDKTAENIETAGDYVGFGAVGKPAFDFVNKTVISPFIDGFTKEYRGGEGGEDDEADTAGDEEMLSCNANDGTECDFVAPNQHVLNQHYMSAHGIARENLPEED